MNDAITATVATDAQRPTTAATEEHHTSAAQDDVAESELRRSTLDWVGGDETVLEPEFRFVNHAEAVEE